MGFALTIITLVVALGITWRYLGSYMAAVFDGRVHYLAWAERPVYRLLGTGPEQEQSWKRYAGSVIIFSAVSFGLTYLIIRIQGSLPLNPQHMGAVKPALSFNTAASFFTNTNWQNYGGETTMSYFSQIGALTVQQFVTPGGGHRRGHRPGAGLLPPQLPDHRELLGGHHPLPALHPAADRLRGRDHLRGPGGGADPGRHRLVSQQPQRRVPDHRPRPDRLHGGHQAAGHQRGRVPQRQLGHHLREPDGPDQLAVDLPAAVHPVRPHLHLRQDGGQRPPRRRPAGGHGDHLRGVGGLHQLRRASGQPGGGGGRGHPDLHGQHGGQRGPLRRHHAPPCSGWPRPTPPPGRPTPRTTRSTPWAASG